MSINIAVISYWKLTELVKQLDYQPPNGVTIRIVNALLDGALQKAKAMEKNNEVDVFVSSGANGYLLSQHIQTPCVEITVTGFDFLLALAGLKNQKSPVAVITFRRKMPYVEQVSHLLSQRVLPFAFNSEEELADMLKSLQHQGFNAVMGGSLVLERAQGMGMATSFLYSEDGILRALDSAVKIGQTKQAEAKKAEELRTIINFAYDGIIATDRNGTITVFNPCAEKITGIPRLAAIGRNVHKTVPGTRLNHIIKTGRTEINQIQSIGDIKILTNRVPIIIKDEIAGAIATFQDVGTIQKAEEKIRQRLYQKGFLAKATFNDIHETSVIMQKVKSEAIKYAHSNATILIFGESGTGKEIISQAIHNESARCKRPFVAINCAALPENLLESELFGYDEGAFTGAKKGGKRGVFELAHEGTIFLDEIGEIPMSIQSRLLRVLQEHEVLRIGGEHIIPVNIRVLSATNKNLWEMVKTGQFREDLYYRLCVLKIQLPPLRQRQEDIPIFASQFLQEFRQDLPEKLVRHLAHNPLLLSYRWPGNIRQLRNIIERFAVLYDGTDSPDEVLATVINRETDVNQGLTSKEQLLCLLDTAGGNKAEVARKLGISRTTLWRKLRE